MTEPSAATAEGQVRIGRAAREIGSAPVLWAVIVGAVLLEQLSTLRWLLLLNLLVGLFLTGFEVTLSRRVALGEARIAPPLAEYRDFFRRSFGLIGIFLPWILVVSVIGAVLSALGGLLAYLISVPLPDGTWLAAVIGTTGAVLFAFGEVVLVARYVVFDRVAEAYKLREAFAVSWRHRRAAAVPVAFMAVWLGISWALQAAIRLAFDVPIAQPVSLGTLVSSGPTPRLVGAVAAGAAVQLAGMFVALVGSHLLGQYCRVAYGGALEMAGPGLGERLARLLPYPLGAAEGVDTSVESNSRAVQLCAEGADAEIDGRPDEARRLYELAFDSAEDDFDAAVAAHYVARMQATAESMLSWNQVALKRAQAVDGDRMRGFMPSLYASLGRSYELVGDQAEARRYYQLAGEAAAQLPAETYAEPPSPLMPDPPVEE